MISSFKISRNLKFYFLRTLASVVLTIFMFWLAASSISAQQQTSPPPITITNIKDNIYMVKGGSGANCYFLAGQKSLILFDSKMTPESFKQMIAEIQKIAPLPLSMIILTHSDGDHINGLRGLSQKMKIVSHQKAYEEMLPLVEKEPELKEFLPNETYDQTRILNFEGKRLDLKNFGPAHTSGDTVTFIPSSKVAIVGDLMFFGRDPLIHKNKNGTFFGYLRTLQAMLDYKPEIELFLSGHADPVGRKEVAELLASLKEKEARVRQMIQQGKTLEEIKIAFGIQPPPANAPVRRPSLVEIIWQEIKSLQ